MVAGMLWTSDIAAHPKQDAWGSTSSLMDRQASCLPWRAEISIVMVAGMLWTSDIAAHPKQDAWGSTLGFL